jgi:hypothetical protein
MRVCESRMTTASVRRKLIALVSMCTCAPAVCRFNFPRCNPNAEKSNFVAFLRYSDSTFHLVCFSDLTHIRSAQKQKLYTAQVLWPQTSLFVVYLTTLSVGTRFHKSRLNVGILITSRVKRYWIILIRERAE